MLIANRKLTLRDEGADIEVPIRLFLPVRGPRGGWLCRYEIVWPHGLKAIEAGGFDAIQALHNALLMIGSEIYSSGYHKSGKLMFEQPGRGYGFPVANSLRDLLVGDDAKYY